MLHSARKQDPAAAGRAVAAWRMLRAALCVYQRDFAAFSSSFPWVVASAERRLNEVADRRSPATASAGHPRHHPQLWPVYKLLSKRRYAG